MTANQEQPVSVGPYRPEGRVVQICRTGGTLTHPDRIATKAEFAAYVETVRPFTDLSPEAGQVHWADRPGEWPEG